MTNKRQFFKLSLIFLSIMVSFLCLDVCSAQTKTPCGTPKEISFYADQTIDVGTITTFNDGENLYVKYGTKNGWVLSETHLTVATSLENIPQKNGNPTLGNFTYITEHNSITEHLYIINLEENGYTVNTDLLIAAHADVMLLDQYGNKVREEGAWGGNEAFPGKTWATYFSYIVQVCGYEVKDVNIQLDLLQDVGIPFDQISVMSIFSKDTLYGGNQSATLEFADVDQGQIIFVQSADGTPFLVAFVTIEDIINGTFVLTIESIANGLIMANPLMMGFSANDRIRILERAIFNEYYQKLKSEIADAINSEPYNLLNEAVFPKVYEYALLTVINTVKSSPQVNAQANTVLMADEFEAQTIVGEDNTPHVKNIDGKNIFIVNPTLTFYGVDIDNNSPQVISGKDSVWKLDFGIWPPVKGEFVDPVEEKVDLGDGNFNVQFSKLGISTTAKIMGSSANFLKVGCIVLDTFYFCPATNNTIENFVELNPIDFLASAADDIFSSTTVDFALEKTFHYLLKKEVWAPLTQALYKSATDKDAVVDFLKSSKMLLKAGRSVLKVLEAYDAVNETIPFLWDSLFMPLEVNFCVNQTNGILTETCRYIPPKAVANKVSPDDVYVNDTVVFDASASNDDVDSNESLKVRWDFDANGKFDTDWSYNKQASWSYKKIGSYDIILEVMDQDNLIGRTLIGVLVKSQNAGGTANHIKLFRDVLPWSTYSFENIMAANDYSEGPGEKQYEIFPSSSMGSVILYPGKDLVIIMNDQNQNFYNNLAISMDRFNRFIHNGGVVIWEACDLGWAGGSMLSAGINTLPGGVGFTPLYDGVNYNVKPNCALMEGLPNTLTGTFASHEGFFNIPADSVVYMEDSKNFPTLLEYNHERGWVILTGQPLEYNVEYNSDSMGLVYPRLFSYVLNQVVQQEELAPMDFKSPNLRMQENNIVPSHIE